MDETVFTDAAGFAKDIFAGDSSGHDFYHTMRVHDLARTICSREGGDMDTVRLAAILHDVDDRKLFGDNGYANARRFMDSKGIGSDMQETVCHIISQISFKGDDSVVPDSLEGRIVQDADRMDAIGAIGIARTFAYGGSRGRQMHVPGEMHKEGMSEAEYFANQGTSINHFHEKLLKLKDMMNTPTAREMAEHRHMYMVGFLEEFMSEWDGRL
ncbi:MAG: HD domain-containing protein [Candidatus Methanomethylophilaceae archaeon]